EPAPRGNHERLVALDRVHLAREMRKNRRGISGASPDLENLLGAVELEDLEHERNDEWLGDRLARFDRQRPIFICGRRKPCGYEQLSRNCKERVEDRLAANAAFGEPHLHHFASLRTAVFHAKYSITRHSTVQPFSSPEWRKKGDRSI